MCYVYIVRRYICNHQEISPEAQQSGFCLLDPEVCNSAELGRYRVCYVTLNQYCGRCQGVASSMANHAGQWKPGTRRPQASMKERTKQSGLLKGLRESSNTPVHSPSPRRVSHLNNMIQRNLKAALQRREIYVPQTYADILRYIESLPRWLNRKGLIALMEPRFAQIFDEELQNSLRPTLKAVNCEGMLENVMVWTRG
ncbi:hypothetical protein F5Y00DRAFT_267009 [Daldinia vernicosa]|uniref:uncharacterized protein n=1 Tax=Daldinia vernicosa TaxID=114800 RepID=UPI0020073C3C|nr:uncharacterized protein F5Y00DRAFT_267009 [Daldinia vernicosa]KAI0843987.1 hypothetical protein F5Y00DRAFT_267009 [Daldinia vernicosa]